MVNRDVGTQPRHPAMRKALAKAAAPNPMGWKVIVHHYTDTPEFLQLEVEFRCPVRGIQFQRIRIDHGSF